MGFLLVLLTLVTNSFASHPKCAFSNEFPTELFDNILSYLDSQAEFNALGLSSKNNFQVVQRYSQMQLAQKYSRLKSLFPPSVRRYISQHFCAVLLRANRQGFACDEHFNEFDLVGLVLWMLYHESFYISPTIWRRLKCICSKFFDECQTLQAGFVYGFSSVLKAHILHDCVRKGASRAVFFICQQGAEAEEEEVAKLHACLFENLLRYASREPLLSLFADSVRLLVCHLGRNLEWLPRCIEERNTALFDALISEHLGNNSDDEQQQLQPQLSEIVKDALFAVCKTGLVSEFLASRPDTVPDTLIPESMRLCVHTGNWRMAKALLRARRLSVFDPVLSPSTAAALKALILPEQQSSQETFSVDTFHHRFGVQPELLQIVAELGIPDVVVYDRFEQLFATGAYHVQRTATMKPAYLCRIRPTSCALS